MCKYFDRQLVELCVVKVRSTGADDVPDASFQAVAASTLRTAVDPAPSAPLADVEPQPDSTRRWSSWLNCAVIAPSCLRIKIFYPDPSPNSCQSHEIRVCQADIFTSVGWYLHWLVLRDCRLATDWRTASCGADLYLGNNWAFNRLWRYGMLAMLRWRLAITQASKTSVWKFGIWIRNSPVGGAGSRHSCGCSPRSSGSSVLVFCSDYCRLHERFLVHIDMGQHSMVPSNAPHTPLSWWLVVVLPVLVVLVLVLLSVLLYY